MTSSSTMRVRLTGRAAIAVLCLLGLAGSAFAAEPGRITIIAPAAPGGGWDSTARAMQSVLRQSGAASSVQVENVAGAGGTRGLVQFVRRKGNADTLMVSGLIMMGATISNRTPITLLDVTPIARLTSEWEAIAVTRESKVQSMRDLIAALKANPAAVSWGGGSAGGSDQICAALVARAAGVDPRKINYVAHSGGGESLAAILGNHVTLGINSVSEFMPQVRAGKLRIIGVSSGQRLSGIDAPTFREAGLDVVLGNWRAVFAPPGISAAERARISALVDRMVKSPGWTKIVAEREWVPSYLGGEEFEKFLAQEQTRVASVLKALGIVR